MSNEKYLKYIIESLNRSYLLREQKIDAIHEMTPLLKDCEELPLSDLRFIVNVKIGETLRLACIDF